MSMVSNETPQYDVVVVGAGIGGLYAMHKFGSSGLRVLGVEGAPDVGGVWYHNTYPGARVDVESFTYTYMFDPELFREWKWSERWSRQPEILAYLNHVADRYGVREKYRFSTWVEGAQWDPDNHMYEISLSTGEVVTSRYLVMATGNLSEAKKPNFDGIDDFEGQWLLTQHWPHEKVDLAGKRVGVIGTGSSGIQTITAIAPEVDELLVFQRTANYCVPSMNREYDLKRHERVSADPQAFYEELLNTPGGLILSPAYGPARNYSEETRRQMLEERWTFGGQAIMSTFTDQATDIEVNTWVSDFIREKTLEIIKDPVKARKVLPTAYPVGTRRIGIESGYLETYNRDNVDIVDIKADPIARITPKGIQLESGEHHELDVIIFALGFQAFTGALDKANIRNEHGDAPTDSWKRGPRTFLGLMTAGFPNLFVLAAPHSPSVISNLNVMNVFHVDYVNDLIAHARANGSTSVVPTAEAEQAWIDHSATFAENLLRRKHNNYMVHVNSDDGSRMFIPYAGGLANYVKEAREIAAKGYEGIAFGSVAGESDGAGLVTASQSA